MAKFSAGAWLRKFFTLSPCLRLWKEKHSTAWVCRGRRKKEPPARPSESRWAAWSTTSVGEPRQRSEKIWTTSPSRPGSSRSHASTACGCRPRRAAGYLTSSTGDRVSRLSITHGRRSTNLHDLCPRASQLHLHGATDLYGQSCSVFQGARDHRPDHCGGGGGSWRSRTGWEFEFRRNFSRNRGQGVGAGVVQAWRPQEHWCAYRFAAALRARRMASDPNLPAKVALESRFEFSVEKARCTHQWTGASGHVHTAPTSGQIQWQQWNAFRRVCRQFSRSRDRGQRPQLPSQCPCARLWFLRLLWLCRTEARRTERQRRGSLADLAVEAVTLERYRQTLWNFFRYLDVFGKPLPCTVWR